MICLCEHGKVCDVCILSHKVEVYENVLHKIQLYSNVTMDMVRLHRLIGLICDWSYAHRSGNGEFSEEEQKARIQIALEKMNNEQV